MDSDAILAPLVDMVDQWYEGWGRGPTQDAMRDASIYLKALPPHHPHITATPLPDGKVQLAWTRYNGEVELRDF